MNYTETRGKGHVNHCREVFANEQSITKCSLTKYVMLSKLQVPHFLKEILLACEAAVSYGTEMSRLHEFSLGSSWKFLSKYSSLSTSQLEIYFTSILYFPTRNLGTDHFFMLFSPVNFCLFIPAVYSCC